MTKVTLYHSLEAAVRWEIATGCALESDCARKIKNGTWYMIPADMRATALKLILYWSDIDLVREKMRRYKQPDASIRTVITEAGDWDPSCVKVALALRAARQLPDIDEPGFMRAYLRRISKNSSDN